MVEIRSGVSIDNPIVNLSDYFGKLKLLGLLTENFGEVLIEISNEGIVPWIPKNILSLEGSEIEGVALVGIDKF